MKDVVLLRVTVEVLTRIQPGQMVALGLADQVAVLRELDGAFDARLHDLRNGIRLRNEVDRADVEALDLGFLIGRQNDHGDLRRQRILLHFAEDVETVPVGQVQIKQNEADLPRQRKKRRLGFRARPDRDDLVLRIQDGDQDLAVDELVLDDQYFPFSFGSGLFLHFVYRDRDVHVSILLAISQIRRRRRFFLFYLL